MGDSLLQIFLDDNGIGNIIIRNPCGNWRCYIDFESIDVQVPVKKESKFTFNSILNNAVNEFDNKDDKVNGTLQNNLLLKEIKGLTDSLKWKKEDSYDKEECAIIDKIFNSDPMKLNEIEKTMQELEMLPLIEKSPEESQESEDVKKLSPLDRFIQNIILIPPFRDDIIECSYVEIKKKGSIFQLDNSMILSQNRVQLIYDKTNFQTKKLAEVFKSFS